ncbi:MAG: hypothetical protein R2762_03220 [Bryobacteraceae bacterium]
MKTFATRAGSSILSLARITLAGLAMVACLTMTSAAFGADLNGKWTGEMQTKKGGNPLVLELKADGAALTGTMSRGKRGRGVEIKDGKVDGNSFTFTVMQKTKKGERATEWKGTLEGDEIKLSPNRKRAAAITLKRG